MADPRHLSSTRRSYDVVSADYATLLRYELVDKPLDRALLSTFAELVARDGGGTVLDAGCGPGRITDFLCRLGVDAYGVDLSPGMVAVARRSYPELRFEVGDIAHLPDDAGALAGIVAWYSTIHTPPDRRPAVLREFRRVLRCGGPLLLAFHIGDGLAHRDHAYGHDVDLDHHYIRVPEMVQLLAQGGFTTEVQVERAPAPPEQSSQAYLIAVAR